MVVRNDTDEYSVSHY